jgi:maltose O-acetyltransferase
MRAFLSELRLYLANIVVANTPVHSFRLFYYRRFMGFCIGSGSSVFMGCRFDCAGGLTVGANSTINDGCFLDTRGSIRIGSCVAITSGVWISTAKHDLESPCFIASFDGVEIEDYAFIGRRSTILQGCRIGRGAVLGAGSVLTKSIPEFEVWAGNPARKIGERNIRDLRYNCNYFRFFH